MNIAYLRDGLGGLNVHEMPDGKIIDALDPNMWAQLAGTKSANTGSVEWIEVTYSRPKELPQRGWVRKDMLEIHRDPLFRDNLTVHERQVEYKNSVSFQNSTDLPQIDLSEYDSKPLVNTRRAIIAVLILAATVLCLFCI